MFSRVSCDRMVGMSTGPPGLALLVNINTRILNPSSAQSFTSAAGWLVGVAAPVDLPGLPVPSAYATTGVSAGKVRKASRTRATSQPASRAARSWSSRASTTA